MDGKDTVARRNFFALALRRVPYLILAASCFAPSAAYAGKHSHFRFAVRDNALVMLWAGVIEAPMSTEISAAFELNKNRVKAVELKLNSGGGSVKEGEKVIRVLQDIRRTHKLVTSVGAGHKCGSMCVFIYVQGQKRFAAPASLWLFHEVSIADRKTHRITRLDRARWEELVQKYLVPAGVNQAWINEVESHTDQTDYWQTGQSLIQNGSNLIHRALPDERHRRILPVQESPSQHSAN
jgi:ATP-dependent protease ClpP protease subunit